MRAKVTPTKKEKSSDLTSYFWKGDQLFFQKIFFFNSRGAMIGPRGPALGYALVDRRFFCEPTKVHRQTYVHRFIEAGAAPRIFASGGKLVQGRTQDFRLKTYPKNLISPGNSVTLFWK